MIISTHDVDLLTDSGISGEEILVMNPEKEGTIVTQAASIQEIKELLEAGMSAGEAIMPHTRPKNIDQMSLFDL